jgi:hypothetical protein
LAFQRTLPVRRLILYSAPLFFCMYSERLHSTGGNSMSSRPVTRHCATNGGRSGVLSGRSRVRALL